MFCGKLVRYSSEKSFVGKRVIFYFFHFGFLFFGSSHFWLFVFCSDVFQAKLVNKCSRR